MCYQLVPFYFKVECVGPGGDNYIGHWMVLAHDTKRALNLLETSDKYKKAIGTSHPPNIIQINANQITNTFSQLVYELIYDCYN
jgi:hypothetical protein